MFTLPRLHILLRTHRCLVLLFFVFFFSLSLVQTSVFFASKRLLVDNEANAEINTKATKRPSRRNQMSGAAN